MAEIDGIRKQIEDRIQETEREREKQFEIIKENRVRFPSLAKMAWISVYGLCGRLDGYRSILNLMKDLD